MKSFAWQEEVDCYLEMLLVQDTTELETKSYLVLSRVCLFMLMSFQWLFLSSKWQGMLVYFHGNLSLPFL